MQPDCVLIEGPPDANAALSIAGDEAMNPPVALLVHAVSDPARAVFYPFARFSPEWVALRWALAHRVAVRFIDLPIALQLGDEGDEEPPRGRRPAEPLAELARVAGYEDVDLFWERLVETAAPAEEPLAIFQLIEQAMRAARAGHQAIGLREARREAHMRQEIRAAERALFQRIAVVVGAWHAPALALEDHTVKADRALLKGLSKTRTEVAWIPWTSSRLATASGYGAGVEAPGWYAHLFAEAGERGASYQSVATAWAAKAARLLRAQGMAMGPALAVEVVRTADALATLRELAAAGLAELREAILAVICAGEARWLELIQNTLEVGDELGEVPAGAPATPLRRDVTATMRRLRLKPVAEEVHREWDLRKPLDRDRVVFLHRLRALGVTYGERLAASGDAGAGTFKEVWVLRWDPELEVELALAARWGNDVASAARGKLLARVLEVGLGELADDLELALDARLDVVVEGILAAMGGRVAATSEVPQLGRALPGLARVMRYSDVRGTERALVEPVFDALLSRFVVRLPAAVRVVDEEGAALYAELVDAVSRALALVGGDRRLRAWHQALSKIIQQPAGSIHQPLVSGRAARALVDTGELGAAELTTIAALALGHAVAPEAAARWIEGLVRGSAILLEHQVALLESLDRWLDALTDEGFARALPVLRRSFSAFSKTERRRLGARIANAAEETEDRTGALALERVERLRPVLEQIYRARGAEP